MLQIHVTLFLSCLQQNDKIKATLYVFHSVALLQANRWRFYHEALTSTDYIDKTPK